jgi:hypothetical protein
MKQHCFMEDHQFDLPPHDDKENFLLCRVCGEWVDRRNPDEVFDHLEHTTGTILD